MIKVTCIAYPKAYMNVYGYHRTFSCNCKDEKGVDTFFKNIIRLGYKTTVSQTEEVKTYD